MCRDCGCEDGNERAWFGRDGGGHDHPHDHEHPHHHGPPHADREGVIHVHLPRGVEVHLHFDDDRPPLVVPSREGGQAHGPRRVEIEARVLAENDRLAAANRERLARHGAVAVNLISSPGSGKTALLERTLEALAGEIPLGVIVGDQQTDRDARRLAGRGAPVEQIETRSACHLDAAQVAGPLGRMLEAGVRLVLIENVGNLVCPAAFDLGEHRKVALLSVTEGEDKPVKYPVLFHEAPLVVITKLDLAQRADWDRAACYRAIRTVNGAATVLEVSARTGDGLDRWISALRGIAATAGGPVAPRAAANDGEG